VLAQIEAGFSEEHGGEEEGRKAMKKVEKESAAAFNAFRETNGHVMEEADALAWEHRDKTPYIEIHQAPAGSKAHTVKMIPMEQWKRRSNATMKALLESAVPEPEKSYFIQATMQGAAHLTIVKTVLSDESKGAMDFRVVRRFIRDATKKGVTPEEVEAVMRRAEAFYTTHSPVGLKLLAGGRLITWTPYWLSSIGVSISNLYCGCQPYSAANANVRDFKSFREGVASSLIKCDITLGVIPDQPHLKGKRATIRGRDVTVSCTRYLVSLEDGTEVSEPHAHAAVPPGGALLFGGGLYKSNPPAP
jgi:hypothetical protein